MRARLAAIDLDGTLLRSDGTISRRTRAALAAAAEAGIVVVLVTARSPRSVRVIAEDVGLGGIAICANGATIYDLDADEIVLHRPLSPEVAHRVVRGLRELRARDRLRLGARAPLRQRAGVRGAAGPGWLDAPRGLVSTVRRALLDASR